MIVLEKNTIQHCIFHRSCNVVSTENHEALMHGQILGPGKERTMTS
jgi:hypothetical protein